MLDPFFLSIIGCFVGLCILLYVHHQQVTSAPQVDLREKLRALAVDPDAMAKEIELGIERKSVLSLIDFRSIFERFTGKNYMNALEKELTQCDIPLKPGEFIFVRIVVILLAVSATQLLIQSVYATFAVFILMLFFHVPVLKIKRSMRISKFVLQLAEFLVLITNSLRSGQTFLQGVDIASRDSPNPIGMEFRLLLKETNLGIPVETAFANMLIRVPSEDLKIVMSAFSIQRNVGGNLADIMDQVADMIRQRITIQGQIKVLTTQGKLSGAIVGLLPIGLGIIISFMNYDYMSQLWTPRREKNLSFITAYLGPLLLAFGLFMELVGCFVIYKICDIEV